MQNRYERWDTEPRHAELQSCPYTGIQSWQEPDGEWAAMTKSGYTYWSTSRSRAISLALDALRIEREHARANEEIPFDGSTPQSVIDAENLREVEAYGPSF